MDFTKALYVIIVAFCSFLAYLSQKTNRKLFLVFSIIVVVLFAGLRGRTVGVDTNGYYEIIISSSYNTIYRNDVAFSYISKFLMAIFDNPSFAIFIYSAVIYSLIIIRFWDFREKISIWLCVLIFLFLQLPASMSGIRQFLAIAFVFYGTRFLKDKKILFLVFLAVGTMFHLSALVSLVFLVLDLLINHKANLKGFLLFSLITLLVVAILSNYYYELSNRFIRYFATTEPSKIGLMQFYKIAILFVFLVFNRFSFETRKRESLCKTIDLDCFIYYLLGIAFSFVGYFLPIIQRVGWYFLMFEPIFWGQVIKTQRHKYLLTALCLVFVGYSLLHDLIYDGYQIFPYVSSFE